MDPLPQSSPTSPCHVPRLNLPTAYIRPKAHTSTVHFQAQGVVATPPCRAEYRNFSRTSAGVFQRRVLRAQPWHGYEPTRIVVYFVRDLESLEVGGSPGRESTATLVYN